ncbi:hypothetical protein DL769_009028 [Monosporascus sp. CRB-8-3]|nr:hypothetical protein DL769_009028 [Monosporascus sp. CRB-8-3]
MDNAANSSTESSRVLSQDSTTSTVESRQTSVTSTPLSDVTGQSKKWEQANTRDGSQQQTENEEARNKDKGQQDEADPMVVAESEVKRSTEREFQARFKKLQNSFSYGAWRTNLFNEADKAEFLVRSLKSLQWLYEAVTSEPEKSEPESEPKESKVRIRATPEIKHLTWDEWRKSSGSWREPHSSIYVLSEEPPALSPLMRSRKTSRLDLHGRGLQADPTAVSARRAGAKPLPPRIRIASAPVKRILDSMCNDDLRWEGDSALVLLRPYKILVYHEQNIRKRLAELQQACENHEEKAKGEDEAEPGRSEVGGIVIFRTNTDWNTLTLDEKQEAARDFGFLVTFMDEYISPLNTRRSSGGDNLVHFHELWHILSPGTLVYVKDKAVHQKVWKVLQGTGGRRALSLTQDINDQLQLGGWWQDKSNPFKLDCYYIDFNGVHFVRVVKTFSIKEFSEAQPVKALPIVPFSIAEKEGLVNRDVLLDRGKDFVDCTKPSYKYYGGRSLSHAPTGDRLKRPDAGSLGSIAVLSEAIESHVMVDFERCLQAIPDWNPSISASELSKAPENELQDDPVDSSVEDDRVWDVRMAEEILEFSDRSQTLGKHDKTPMGDELLLLPDRLFAFVLRTRRWACLQLGFDDSNPPGKLLRPVDPNPEAWNYLQIDPNHRSVIESLMKTHFDKAKSQRRQFDLIQDKGKGLIVLLHGVPGVGKTSTAETVAEYYNKPLLPIICGLSPAEVETSLQTSFQMAQAWECVLLLDEADVFLAERSRDNVERNALVSVFLRVLEYYEGILFLTTNKVGSFDEAFKSRISMALYYPPLSAEHTLAIWITQMNRTRKMSIDAAPNDDSQHVDFDTEGIKLYAQELWVQQQTVEQFKPAWNGRQIRNAFQTAVALAEVRRQPGEKIRVTRSHFEQVAAVSNEFNFYLWRTKHQRGDLALNLKKEYRDDGFPAMATNLMTSFPSGSASFPLTNAAGGQAFQQGYPTTPQVPQTSAQNVPNWGGSQSSFAQMMPPQAQQNPNLASSMPLNAPQTSSLAPPTLLGPGQQPPPSMPQFAQPQQSYNPMPNYPAPNPGGVPQQSGPQMPTTTTTTTTQQQQFIAQNQSMGGPMPPAPSYGHQGP